ncbi:unnamed protein product [Closterium sp. NIES-53]
MLKGHPNAAGGAKAASTSPQREWPLWSVHVALAVVMLNNGVYHVLAKRALAEGVHALVFCVYRDAIALLALLPAAALAERSQHHLMSPKLLLPFFLLGLTGILGNQLLFLLGLNLTGPTTAAALQPSIPVFTLLLALLLGLDSLNLQQWRDQVRLVGLALCVGGAVLMAVFRGPLLLGEGGEQQHGDTALLQQQAALPPGVEGAGGGAGDGGVGGGGEGWVAPGSVGAWSMGVVSLVGNCMSMAAYLTIQVPVLRRFPAPVTVTAMAYVVGALLMLLIALLSSPPSWIITGWPLVAVVFAGVVTSALNYALMTAANRRVGPATVALYNPLQPVASATLSYLCLASPIFLGSVIGGFLVLSGLYLVVWGAKAQEPSSTHHHHAPAEVAALAEHGTPVVGQEEPEARVLGSPPSLGPPPPFLSQPPIQSQSQLQPASPLPGPSPYSTPTRGHTKRRESESRPVSPDSRSASPVRTVRAGRRVSRPRPPPVPGTHSMTLRPSTAPQRVPLPSPPASSLPAGPDLASDSLHAASPAVTCFLATACEKDR